MKLDWLRSVLRTERDWRGGYNRTYSPALWQHEMYLLRQHRQCPSCSSCSGTPPEIECLMALYPMAIIKAKYSRAAYSYYL